jgi:hypothetical protein
MRARIGCSGRSGNLIVAEREKKMSLDNRFWKYPALAQQRAEGVPQGMNVKNTSPFIPLSNPGKSQIAVEKLAQFVRDVED